jgi:hypothetical protein
MKTLDQLLNQDEHRDNFDTCDSVTYAYPRRPIFVNDPAARRAQHELYRPCHWAFTTMGLSL